MRVKTSVPASLGWVGPVSPARVTQCPRMYPFRCYPWIPSRTRRQHMDNPVITILLLSSERCTLHYKRRRLAGRRRCCCCTARPAHLGGFLFSKDTHSCCCCCARQAAAHEEERSRRRAATAAAAAAATHSAESSWQQYRQTHERRIPVNQTATKARCPNGQRIQ